MKPNQPVILFPHLLFVKNFLPEKLNTSIKKLIVSFSFILLAILCFPKGADSQTRQNIAPGEYATYNIDASGKLWASGGNAVLWGTGGVGRQALPNLVKQQSGASMPNFKGAYAGLDDAAAIDVSGNVWHIGGSDLSAAGDGSVEPGTDMTHKYATKIFTDSTGAAFTGITMVSQYWQSYTCKGWFAIKGSDSTLWMWGGDDLGNFNGTGVPISHITHPFKVTIPGNKKVVQVVSGTFVIARCSDGTVLTWGGGDNCDDYYAALGNGCTGTSHRFPRQVIGISNCKWVDGGRDRAFAICVNGSDTAVWAWGRRSFIGVGTTNGTPETVPVNVTSIWNLPHGVAKIVSNVNASHLILSDSTLWAFGNSPQGEVGNGIELDRNQAPYPDWWSWDYATSLFVTSPVQLNPTRHDFINSYGAMVYTYWFFDESVNGQLYFNGRNKGAIANDGVINSDTTSGGMASYYDNAWDVVTSIPVNPFSLRSPILVPAEPCVVNNTNTGCNGYTPPPVLPPTINAGSDQSITANTTIVTAISTPAAGRKVASYIWKQVSGPGTAYFSTFNDSTVTISKLLPGTYVFRITATDNLNSKSTDDITVNVNAGTGTGTYNGGIQMIGGDYTATFIGNDGVAIAIGNEGFSGVGGNTSAAGSTGIPKVVLSAPGVTVPKIKTGAGHYHGSALVDVNGHVWTTGATGGGESGMGNDNYSPYAQKILTDTSGNLFDSVAMVAAVAQSTGDDIDQNGYLAVKSTGTLWYWGTVGAMKGNGNTDENYKALKPTRIFMPGGRSVSQIVGGQNKYVIALCTDGTVWTWGNGYRANLGYISAGTEYATPHQVLAGVSQIAGGDQFNYAIKANGELWGWGLLGNLMNDQTFAEGTGAEITFPILLTNIQSYLPSTIQKIVTSVATTTVLLADQSIYSWGDNTQGGIGNGKTYFGNFFGNDSAGYSYDGVIHLLQKVPVNIAPTRKFKNIFSGNLLVYYTYALGTDDQLYGWGINRSSEIANRVEQPISGSLNGLDNSWNVTWPTPVNPFTIPLNSTRIISTSPMCLTNNGFPCSAYPIPANTKPVANAGPNQSVSVSSATLDGRGSTDNVYISYYIWSQVSGPNTAIMDLPASPTPRISGLVTGTYVFKLKTTDNGWFSDSTTVHVAVNAAGNIPPTANAGANQIISLPVSGVTLSGSGAANNGGSIISHNWTKLSGGSASITDTSGYGTAVTGFSAGTYVFRLTVIQNDNQTATSDVTITVNAAASNAKIIAGKIEAESFDTKSGGMYGMPTSDAGGGQHVIGISNGSWMDYNVNVTQSGVYIVNFRVATPQAAQFQVKSGNTVLATIIIPSTGGWDNWVSVPVSNVSLAAGIQTIRILSVSNGTCNFNWMDWALTPGTQPSQPPAANAGSSQIITLPANPLLPANQVTLSGSGAANNGGSITSHIWSKLSGGSATITDPSNYGTTVTNLSAGTYTFRLTVTQNDNQIATSDVTITVNPAASNGKTIPGRIEAESFDIKSGGMYAVPTTDAGGGQQVIGISNGSWMDYNVNVTQSGTYTINFRVATTQSNAQFQVRSGNTILGNINIPNTGGWDSWVTVPVSNVSLTAGAQTIRILSINNEACNFNWMDWIVNPPASNGKTIPGKIEAESWDMKSGGMYAVATTDAGGGQQVIGISNTNWMDYNVNVLSAGIYTVNFRVATTQAHAQFQVISGNTILATINILNTGGWNDWVSVPLYNVSLAAGTQTIRILSTNNETCNFNWMDFILNALPVTGQLNAPPVGETVQTVPGHKEITASALSVSIFPNPSTVDFNMKVQSKSVELLAIKVFDMSGRQLQQMQVMPGQSLKFGAHMLKGTYLVEIRQGSERVITKIVKQ